MKYNKREVYRERGQPNSKRGQRTSSVDIKESYQYGAHLQSQEDFDRQHDTSVQTAQPMYNHINYHKNSYNGKQWKQNIPHRMSKHEKVSARFQDNRMAHTSCGFIQKDVNMVHYFGDPYYMNQMESLQTRQISEANFMSCNTMMDPYNGHYDHIVEDMILNQFTNPQINFEKANSDDMVTLQQDNYQQWLGDEYSNFYQTADQVQFAEEVLDAPEDESQGNSIDRFIRNGYTDEEINDDEYLSDQSLKDFLQTLKKNNQVQKYESQQNDMNLDQREQDQAFDSFNGGVPVTPPNTLAHDGTYPNEYPSVVSYDVASPDDRQKSVKDNISLINFFKSSQKVCLICHKQAVKSDSPWQNKEPQICSKCKNSQNSQETPYGSVGTQTLQGKPSSTSTNTFQDDDSKYESNIRDTMYHHTFKTLNQRIERLTMGPSSGYGAGFNRKKQHQWKKE